MKLLVAVQALFSSVRSEDDGATAVEYGLIISLIAMFILAAVALVGTNLSNIFNTLAGQL